MRSATVIAGLLIFAFCMPITARATGAGDTIMSQPQHIALEQWRETPGDMVMIDTKANIGYIFKTNGSYTSFLVATGQRRWVTYIGMTYKADTPTRDWIVLSKETKGDRTTFGKYGTFMRFSYADDETRSPYGFHSHRSAAAMLARDDRFASMGCVIVSDDVLDVIDRTFQINEGRMRVKTVYGLTMPFASNSMVGVGQSS